MPGREIIDLEECREIRQILASRPPAVVNGTLFLLVAVLAGAVIWAAASEADLIAKASGTVRPVDEAVRVQTARRGEVEEALFDEGDAVRRGQVLLRLDDERLRVELSKVERDQASLEEERRNLERLEEIVRAEIGGRKRAAEIDLAVARAGVERERALERERREKALSELDLARDAFAKAGQRKKRASSLLEDGVLSVEEFERVEGSWREAEIRLELARDLAREDATALALAMEKVTAAEQALRVAVDSGEARLQELRMRLIAARARQARLEKERERLAIDLEQCVVRAPIDGVVTDGEPQPGDVLEAGDLVAAIAPRGDLRFDVLVPNSEIAGLRPGQSARVKLDAYPYQQYGVLEGEITYIAPDATRIDGERGAGRSFYEIRIQLRDDGRADGLRLELGMTGLAEIVRGRQTLLELAFLKLQDRVEL